MEIIGQVTKGDAIGRTPAPQVSYSVPDLNSDPTELAGRTTTTIMGFSGKSAAFLQDQSREPSYRDGRLTARTEFKGEQWAGLRMRICPVGAFSWRQPPVQRLPL